MFFRSCIETCCSHLQSPKVSIAASRLVTVGLRKIVKTCSFINNCTQLSTYISICFIIRYLPVVSLLSEDFLQWRYGRYVTCYITLYTRNMVCALTSARLCSNICKGADRCRRSLITSSKTEKFSTCSAKQRNLSGTPRSLNLVLHNKMVLCAQRDQKLVFQYQSIRRSSLALFPIISWRNVVHRR